MFDLGWSELLVIGVVALIVVGPKDLPVLFRNVGFWVGKMRGMAREFSRAMNDAADETGMRDVAKGLRSATNPIGSAMDGVRKTAKDFGKDLDPTKFEPDSETGKLAAEKAQKSRAVQASVARAHAERKAREADEALRKAEEAEALLEESEPETRDQA